MYFYIQTKRRNRHTDTYVFIPSKFELPANAASNRATKALEELTAPMKSKKNWDIQFTNESINNTIGVLSNLLKPTTRAASSTATRPRISEAGVQRAKVDSNNNNNRLPRVNNTNDDVRPPRVLRLQQKVHQQKYSGGIRVYRIFGEPNRLVEYRGYICNFDKKKGYYKVKYQNGNTEEYNEKEIETMLHKIKRDTSILQALSATKHGCIVEEYTTVETIYTPS